MNVTRLQQPVGSFHIERGEHVIVGNMGLSLTPRAAFLDVEHVNGNMLGPRALEPVEVLSPDIETLMRQAGDQIDVDVLESMCPERLHIAKDIGRTVQPPGMPEIFVTKRLHAKTDAIHACCPIPLEP